MRLLLFTLASCMILNCTSCKSTDSGVAQTKNFTSTETVPFKPSFVGKLEDSTEITSEDVVGVNALLHLLRDLHDGKIQFNGFPSSLAKLVPVTLEGIYLERNAGGQDTFHFNFGGGYGGFFLTAKTIRIDGELSPASTDAGYETIYTKHSGAYVPPEMQEGRSSDYKDQPKIVRLTHPVTDIVYEAVRVGFFYIGDQRQSKRNMLELLSSKFSIQSGVMNVYEVEYPAAENDSPEIFILSRSLHLKAEILEGNALGSTGPKTLIIKQMEYTGPGIDPYSYVFELVNDAGL